MQDVSRIPLAIVGMACRLPGADSIDEYWSLLTEGRSGLGELPPDRFDREKQYDPNPGQRTRTYTSLGGVVTPRPFDLSRYPLPQWLIDQTAGCHLNMCEVAARAFEHAGWDPLNPPHRNAGVFIGHAPPMSQLSPIVYARQIAHTAEFLREIPELETLVPGQTDSVIGEIVDAVRHGIHPDDPRLKLRAHANYLPALLSRQFQLDGPSVAFDAACASSLRALAHGARALQLGEVDMAVVGSASYCHADTLVIFSQAQSVSATGSRPFDEDADGLIAAEGYVILLIKTLEKALADGDRIRAIIRGIGISSDGKGKSLWAPRKEGQTEAVRRAYTDEVHPRDLQYIEMHATSTQVGDSTEMAALVEGLAPLLPPGRVLPVGSAKANIGHALETAGLASVAKTVLAIEHGLIPPQINLNKLNSKIDWDNIPFRPSTVPLEWPEPEAGKPRRAAVNSFGVGGLNVHVVIESHEPELSQGVAQKFADERKAEPPVDPDENAIAVIGLGAVLPGVRTIEQLWDVLASGEDQRTDPPAKRWNGDVGYAPGADRLWSIGSRRGGFCGDYEFDWKKYKIPPKQVQTGAMLQWMLLDAADQALGHSGYHKKPLPKERTGVVIGTIFGTEFGDKLQMCLRLANFESTLQEVLSRRGVPADRAEQVALDYREVLLQKMPALLDETGGFTASTLASRITKTFDLMGGAVAVDAGDASTLAALNAAAQMLLTRECDMMLCTSGDQSLSFAHFESQARQGRLARTGNGVPFDAASDGLVPGEGACVLVLKRLADAKRDGDNILAIVRGIGTAWDDSVEAGTKRAAERALAKAGISAADVAAVEASAKGLRTQDEPELRAIDETYSTADRAGPVQVGAAAFQFGHLGGGSGVVSLVRAIEEVDRAEMLPVAGLTAPADFARDTSGRQLAVARAPLAAAHAEGRLFAAVNSVSQGGQAWHAIIERPTKVAAPVQKTPSSGATIYRVGAASWEALHAKLSAVARGVGSISNAAFTPADRVRAAIVAQDAAEAIRRCEHAVAAGVEAHHADELLQLGVICGTTGSTRAVLPAIDTAALKASLGTSLLADRAIEHLLAARACLEVIGALDGVAGVERSEPPVDGSTDVAPTGLVAGSTGLDIVRLAGSPYEMGYQHGRAFSRQIRVLVRRYADLAGSRWDAGPALDEAVVNAARYFTPDELEELRGIAKGADVSPGSVIGHNLRLMLDGGAGGAHFLASGPAGLIHGFNEDLRQALAVRDCVARGVQVRHPQEGLAHLLVSPVGIAGGLSGVNARGLAVSAACLLDVASRNNPGRLVASLVREILQHADSLDAAVARVRQTFVRTPYTLSLSETATGRAVVVEVDGADIRTRELTGAPLVAVNHRDSSTDAPAHSRHRADRLVALLGAGNTATDTARAALRDQYDPTRQRDAAWPTMNTVRRVDNQVSVVFEAGRVAITPGPLANGHQNHFVELDVASLLGPVALPLRDRKAGRARDVEDTSRPAGHAALLSQSDRATGQSDRAAGSTMKIVTPREVAASYAVGESGRVCERLVMRMQEMPLAPANGSPVSGAAIVLGTNPVAEALVAELQRRNVRVTAIAAGEAEASLAALDAAWSADPATALFVCTGYDSFEPTDLAAEAWNERRARGVLLPYRVIQRWFERVAEAKQLDQATLVAVTALGGDFGFGGAPVRVEGGSLTGLLKGVAMEVAIGKGIAQGFRAKAIDAAPGTSAVAIAEFVCRELAGDPTGIEPEVSLVDGKRLVARPVAQPVESLTRNDLPRGATFVVTGGARGVTAVVARELGLRYGLKLHLIGSSPRPEIAPSYHAMSAEELKEVKSAVMKEALANGEKPADAWGRFEKALEIDKSLRELRNAGVDATYHGCDVSNRQALGQVLDTIRAADGPIVGVIHGAGFERASRFEKKQVELVDRTFAAKVDGAAALMELTANDPIRWFAAFGSVAGRFGGVGQTDYASANDMLAKLVGWYRSQRAGVGAAVFHWHAWDDVGMAVRPESQHIRKLHNIKFMPSLEGAAHLIDELRAGLPEGEVAITELASCREKFGSETVTGGIGWGGGKSAAAEPSPAPAAAQRFPLIDRVVTKESGKLVAEIDLDPVNDLFLRDHLFKNRPMMPVVVTVEALAQAAQHLAGPQRRVTAIRDIEIVNGLRFLTDRPQVGRMHITAHGEQMTCEFTCDVVNRAGVILKKDQPYLRCVVDTSDRPATFEITRPPLPGTWQEIWYHDKENTVIYHGEAFRCISRGTEENGLVWGAMTAPEHGNLAGRRGGAGWIMPSALIDSGFYGSGVMLWVKYQGLVAIPAGIGRIVLGRAARPGEACYAVFTDRGRSGNHSLYDFFLFGEDGSVICQIDGYKNVIVAEQPADAARG